MSNHKLFTVTEDHLKLVRRMRFRYSNHIEFGAPLVNPKRPYGNGYVYGDIGEILGIEPEICDDETDFSSDQMELMLRLHQETAVVLDIASRVGYFKAGNYETKLYGQDWVEL